jgi:hypothetical protein
MIVRGVELVAIAGEVAGVEDVIELVAFGVVCAVAARAAARRTAGTADFMGTETPIRLPRECIRGARPAACDAALPDRRALCILNAL